MSFENILSKVKSHPVLWLPTHKFYKNRTVRGKIWGDIAEELGMDERVLKNRYKYLKDQYRKELKKVMTNVVAESHWQHFDDLEFLKEELLTDDGRLKSKETELDDDLRQEPNNKRARNDSTSTPEGSRCTNSPDMCKNISSKSDSEKLVMVLNRLNRINKNLNTEMRNDPDYMFLMSILPTFKKLSEIQKLMLRGKMNEWLLEALTQNESEVPEPPIFQCKYEIEED
ncbi:transcription factor Adf-1-like [Leptidea sinapis]|uniref:MADF domain-containing protein n=1 Tax=Leptidea sinapis TaxID=189913 RepID=A0A5E4PUP5_9NEOP|nr:transcription factor Adf-1-like [Leptidea sinapis]VVC88873.1 unnamed protein product [Leptidea sinapis]